MKIVILYNKIDFPFEEYCKYILSVAPKSDLAGISELRFVKKFSHPKANKNSLACYLQKTNGNSAAIEINLPNISKERIKPYFFERHPEVASLWLSEIIFHEIGHHVRHLRTHGIKKKKSEKFSNDYAVAGYYHYLKSRKDKILTSYKWGSRNILEWNKEDRQTFKENRQDLINWLEQNKKGIPFP